MWGADGVTYPSVISQPIYDAKAMNWDSPPEDMEYEVFYLINFEYGMDPILVFYIYKLKNGYSNTSGRRSCNFCITSKNFAAPEVLERGNGRIDTKSDIWMLGCTVSASV